MLLVGNGKKLTFVDYQVGQKNSWPLNSTPLGMLLSANPDLKRSAKIMPQKDPRILLVRARDARRPEFGTLLLVFVAEPVGAGRAAALRLDRDRRAEQAHHDQARQPAL